MSITFSGKELLDMAIQIEKNGFAFYLNVAPKIKDARAKELIEWLAGEEKNHIKKFEDIITGLKLKDPDMTPAEAEEYSLYLKALADARVFTSEIQAREAARRITDLTDAVNMAIEFEKDSLLFLHGMKPLVKGSDAAVLEELQREEMLHLKKLAGLK